MCVCVCVFLPAATKLGQSIFSQVCVKNSVHGGGGCLPQCMLGYPPGSTPPRGPDIPPNHAPPGTRPPPDQTPTPPGADTPPPQEADCSIRSTSGRYASYWNAFLLNIICLRKCSRDVSHFIQVTDC